MGGAYIGTASENFETSPGVQAAKVEHAVNVCQKRMPLIDTQALLFDMDGVLIDSTPAVARVWTKWALAHGFEPKEVVRRAHGRPSITTVRELLPHSDHEAENARIERAEIEDIEGVIPLPGALDIMRGLPEHRWAVVTSSTRPLAEARIRAAGLPTPPLFITSSEVSRGKPDPEPYIKAAQALGFSPNDCVVLEDTLAGIEAGKRAGARVIAFPTTIPTEELRRACPDWMVQNCNSIKVFAENGRIRIELKELSFQKRSV
jgi:sugar-phosphatase